MTDAAETNYQIDLSQITQLKELEMIKPSSTNKNRVYLTNSIIYLIGLIIGAVNVYFVDERNWTVIGSLFLIGSLIWAGFTWLLAKYYDNHAYALREKDMSIDEGVFFKSRQTTPYHKIQHVEISQGPIQKRYGHSTLKIFAAGGNGSSTEINGIDKDEAERLRQFLLEKIGEK
jgi:uncharacterized protein